MSDILKEKSLIEQVQGEQEVFEWFTQGMGWQEILYRLRSIYPNVKFTKKDLDLFLARNKELTERAISEDKDLMARHVKANFQFRDKVLEIQKMIYEAMENAHQEKSYSGLAALTNAHTQILKLYAQMTGQLQGDSDTERPQSTSDVVEEVSKNKELTRSELLEKISYLNPKDE